VGSLGDKTKGSSLGNNILILFQKDMLIICFYTKFFCNDMCLPNGGRNTH
jgi:hypothetical protein